MSCVNIRARHAGRSRAQMTGRPWPVWVVAGVILSGLILAGCVPWGRMVTIADTTSGQGITRVTISEGDRLRILTRQGDRPTFVVTAIDEEALHGRRHRVAYVDMVLIERHHQTDAEKTAMAGLAVAAAASVVLLISESGAVVPSGFMGVP